MGCRLGLARWARLAAKRATAGKEFLREYDFEMPARPKTYATTVSIEKAPVEAQFEREIGQGIAGNEDVFGFAETGIEMLDFYEDAGS